LDRVGIGLPRLGLVVVLVWIGALKFANYEADSTVLMLANNPLVRFFYQHGAPEYRNNINREREFNPAHREWYQSNGTYVFSQGLGIVILHIGLSIATHPLHPKTAAIGSFVLIFMALTTLSLLITTPEAWVQPLGEIAHGFPYLSGLRHVIIEGAIMLGAAVITMADSAGSYLRFQY
jgi:reactive chlorine resistance protein C